MKYAKGNIIVGKVTGITKYGVFMSFDNDYVGMVHISEISYDFVKDINDYLHVGDIIKCYVDSIDKQKEKVQLSLFKD